jgi:hypothetical protein
VVGVDAGGGEAQALDGVAADEVLLDDFVRVARVREAIPDAFWVDDEDRTVLALIEAAGLVDADAVLQAGGFHSVFERAAQFLAVLVGATGACGGFVSLIDADEKMAFIVWHGRWMRAAWHRYRLKILPQGERPSGFAKESRKTKHGRLGSARIGVYGF